MIINITIKLLNLYSLIIFLRAIFSWAGTSNLHGHIYLFLCKITDPILDRFRFVSLKLNLPIDLSPIIVIFLIDFIKKILIKTYV